MFGLDRRWVYAAALVGYYFFGFIFSFRVAGFADYAGAAIVGVLSLAWFLFMLSRTTILVTDEKYFSVVLARNFSLVLALYYFASFFVIFVDWQASVLLYKEFSWIKIAMPVTSILMWTGIWVDFYRQRIKVGRRR
ncbi:MAG: hypothetical protein HY833_00115 [Candidatus Aenigmarchaeota archaeon]|nr:hypothetical protein [Candidatus Aenigmarchaeota archaeon]